MPRLVIYHPGRPSRAVALDGRRVRIGRSAECELVVDDEGASRVHAVVRDDDGTFVLEDADSRNGTFVNDERVRERRLRPGDRIRVGTTTELEFVDDEAEPERPSARGRERASAVATQARERHEAAPAREVPSRRRHARAPARSGGPLRLLQRTDYWLEPLSPSRRQRGIRIMTRVTTVGRDAPARLLIPDESVSKLHARLDRQHSELMVSDLKSRNGTTVNGDSVLRSPLEDGDIVGFGDVSFEVVRRDVIAWPRIAALAGALVVIAAGVMGVLSLGDLITERGAVAEAQKRVRAQALQSMRKGIAAFRQGDVEYARSYILYAADVILGSNLAPPGSSLERPEEVLRPLLRELPPEDRDFDFSKPLDPAALPVARAQLEGLSNREYVERQTRRLAIELGLDEKVPAGFVEQVWQFVQVNAAPSSGFQTVLDRSRVLQPQLRGILVQAHLPEEFCYVAWVESGLNPQARSAVGARGLWQFIESSGRLYGLTIDSRVGVDERTDPVKSTYAASRYIGSLLKRFGREQFMCALASYNRGEGGVFRAMEKIDDPMMESSRKFWYLVENRLLPRETSEYVPKIIAAQVVAESPERFGLRKP